MLKKRKKRETQAGRHESKQKCMLQTITKHDDDMT